MFRFCLHCELFTALLASLAVALFVQPLPAVDETTIRARATLQSLSALKAMALIRVDNHVRLPGPLLVEDWSS